MINGLCTAIFITASVLQYGESKNTPIDVFILFYLIYTINFTIMESIKVIVSEKRPCKLEKLNIFQKDKSFPSGHAVCTFHGTTVLTAFSFFFTKYGSKKKKCFFFSISFLSIVFSVVIAISRYFDRKHFIHDIIVGVIMGISTGLVSAHYIKKRIRKDESIMKNIGIKS